MAEVTTNGNATNGNATNGTPNGNPPKRASYKRLIVCSDGTWLSSDAGDKSVPSNVAKLARSIANSGPDAEGNIVNQIVYYHAGLGTGDLPLQKAIYGGLGWGLDVDVLQIYDFISNNYFEGDEVFLFGFSRGAFTVRSVGGLLCDVGVLAAEHMSRFPELWKAYRADNSGLPFTKSEWYLDNMEELGLKPVRVKVVGVWDTVGALGIPEWPVVKHLTMLGVPINKEYAFHDTKVSKYIDYCFHALAIDEKRITFPPTLWHKSTDGPAIDLQQCWFPGVHGNIGGQAEIVRSKSDYEEIGYNTLAWMVDNLSGMLTFEDSAIKLLIEGHRRALNSNKINNGWGSGPIIDNFSGLVGGFFWLLGKMIRTPGDFPRNPGDGTSGATNESFHPIVRIRKSKVHGWHPPSLKGWSLDEPDDRGGWKWVNQGLQDVPEYVLRPEKVMSVAYENGNIVSYGTEPSMARKLCPKNILLDLDRDNGIHDAHENGVSH